MIRWRNDDTLFTMWPNREQYHSESQTSDHVWKWNVWVNKTMYTMESMIKQCRMKSAETASASWKWRHGCHGSSSAGGLGRRRVATLVQGIGKSNLWVGIAVAETNQPTVVTYQSKWRGRVVKTLVPVGSPSRGGHVAVYVFSIN